MDGGSVNNLVFPLLFIAFPAFWLFVVWLISAMSGWQNLARHYENKNHEESPNVQLRWQSLSMGYIRFFAANYQNVVNVGSDGTYLYLSVMFLFRIGHTPLKIPFEDITLSDAKLNFFNTKCAIIKKTPAVKIYLNDGLVKKLNKVF